MKKHLISLTSTVSLYFLVPFQLALNALCSVGG